MARKPRRKTKSFIPISEEMWSGHKKTIEIKDNVVFNTNEHQGDTLVAKRKKSETQFAYNPSEDSSVRFYDGSIQYSDKDLNQRGKMYIRLVDGDEEVVFVTRKVFKQLLINRANLLTQNPQGLLCITDDLFLQVSMIVKLKFDSFDD